MDKYKLEELMTEEELAEWELKRIEEHRKKKAVQKERTHQKSLRRKRICSVDEQIPDSQLEKILEIFRYNLVYKIDHFQLIIGGAVHCKGLKEEEKNELKRMVFTIPSKKLNNRYKMEVFGRKIVKAMVIAVRIREDWEFGCNDGCRELEVLDAKFPSLIGVSFKQYHAWVNEVRKKEGKNPIIYRDLLTKEEIHQHTKLGVSGTGSLITK